MWRRLLECCEVVVQPVVVLVDVDTEALQPIVDPVQTRGVRDG